MNWLLSGQGKYLWNKNKQHPEYRQRMIDLECLTKAAERRSNGKSAA